MHPTRTNITVTTTSPKDWKYVSEGGATIVFSFTGDTVLHPSFKGMVLRLRKISRGIPTAGTETCPQDLQEGDKDEVQMIAFHRKIIARLIPLENLPLLASVCVDRAWLQALADLREPERPEDRRRTDGIDLDSRGAIMATDLVGGAGIVAEIKPKWGFLPSPVHLSAATLPVKARTCRFCMHTYYRSSRRSGDSVPLTRYCPLDLYSGVTSCVEKAIEALWDGWVDSAGSANNLRLFVQGEMIKPDHVSMDLLKVQFGVDDDATALRAKFVSALLPVLLNTPVLRTLATLQRNLDILDIEGLSQLWKTSYAQFNGPIPPLGSASAEPSLDEWLDFLDRYLTAYHHHTLDHAHPQVSDLRYYTLAYLLSATFKDCSIMLKIAPRGTEAIHVIDLDVKDIGRLSRWETLDREIVKSYKGVVQCTP